MLARRAPSRGSRWPTWAAFEVVKDAELIRPLDNPRETRRPSRSCAAAWPRKAIVKLSATENGATTFAGPARVFEEATEAIAAIDGTRAPAGEVLVLRGVGPVGTPGMGMASNVVFALNGAGLTGKVAVVTDGQLSGLVNQGIVVGEVHRRRGGRPAAARARRRPDRHRHGRRGRSARHRLDAVGRSPSPAQHGEQTGGWLGLYARNVRRLRRSCRTS